MDHRLLIIVCMDLFVIIVLVNNYITLSLEYQPFFVIKYNNIHFEREKYEKIKADM